MSDDLPAELRRFIHDHIGSIAQLELLLLLAGDPGKELSAEEAARVCYVTVDAARGIFEAMRADGLVALQPDGSYRFAPRDAAWQAQVQTLAEYYAQRRLTVTHAIYSRPADALQRFADAFRLKRDN
jgi:hypothetical protein